MGRSGYLSAGLDWARARRDVAAPTQIIEAPKDNTSRRLIANAPLARFPRIGFLYAVRYFYNKARNWATVSPD
jgi:hypothetical protein